MAANHGKRGGSVLDMLSQRPLPLSVLPLVALSMLLLLAPSLFSLFKLRAKPTEGHTHLLILSISVILVMLIHWLSSTKVSKPPSKGCCPNFSNCFAEGLLPSIVAAFIVVLVIMGQFQNEIHGGWLLGFG